MRKFWFKRKSFGRVYSPASWQGWLITAGYIALVIFFGLTIDGNSPPREVAFTFGVPVLLLTVVFIRVAYRTGEK